MRRRTLTLTSSLPPEQVAELLDLPGRKAREAGLWCRLDGGRVKARVPNRSEYDTNPALRAHLVRDPRGSVLTGTVRESLLVPFVQWLMLAPGIGMLLVLAGLLTGDPVDLTGVAVCGIGGAVLVAIGLVLRRQRDGGFAVDCDELEHALQRRLQQGSAPRTLRP